MGINQQSLKAILAEHTHSPIQGNILLIGRSTVLLDRDRVSSIFNQYNTPPPKWSAISKETKHSIHGFTFDDRELFLSLSPNSTVDVLDVSSYEGANILCDLNYTVPENLLNKYDFIYDSFVLDNVFNPASLIINVAAMLKPHGRTIMINVASFFPGALVSVHPEWFYGFFAVNKFFDARVYLTENVQKGVNRFCYDTDLWIYRPQFTSNCDYDYLSAVQRCSGIIHTLIIAEKNDAPTKCLTDFQFPMNLQYISPSASCDWASASYHSFDQKRPLMKASWVKNPPPPNPHLTDHYIYIGSSF